jgi:fission process protein 1
MPSQVDRFVYGCGESKRDWCGVPAAIPFIVHPIDNTIHALMNVTLRPAMRKYICGPGQGCLADLEMCSDCKVTPGAASSNGSQP